MSSPLALLVYVAAVVAVAGLGGLASTSGIEGWYADAERPWFTPPDWLFGPVWTVLYAAMAVAAWLVHRIRDRHPHDAAAVLRLWWAQLAVNLAWTPVFFGLRWLWGGLAVIVLLDVLVALLVARCWRLNRAAAMLLVPYLVWIGYATALNTGIAVLN